MKIDGKSTNEFHEDRRNLHQLGVYSRRARTRVAHLVAGHLHDLAALQEAHFRGLQVHTGAHLKAETGWPRVDTLGTRENPLSFIDLDQWNLARIYIYIYIYIYPCRS